jgi:hypothetical protein
MRNHDIALHRTSNTALLSQALAAVGLQGRSLSPTIRQAAADCKSSKPIANQTGGGRALQQRCVQQRSPSHIVWGSAPKEKVPGLRAPLAAITWLGSPSRGHLAKITWLRSLGASKTTAFLPTRNRQPAQSAEQQLRMRNHDIAPHRASNTALLSQALAAVGLQGRPLHPTIRKAAADCKSDGVPPRVRQHPAPHHEHM